jgi:drug/metabolite transporter (DMT)-like permease
MSSASTSIRRGGTPDTEIVSSPHKGDVTTLEIETISKKPSDGDLDEEKDNLLNSEPSASPSVATTAVSVTPSGPDAAMPYIAFWLCMSISVILFNKYLYNGVFSFPLTLTSLHMGFTALITNGMRYSGKLSVPELSWPLYATAVVPIGFLQAFALGLSNLAAKGLSVPFVQMCKALTPMVTLGVGILTGMEVPNIALFVVVALMFSSVVITSLGEIRFEFWSFVCQVLSIVAEAARLTVMQKLLQKHLADKSSPLVSLSLFTPVSFALLLPVALYFEPSALSALSNTTTLLTVLTNMCVAFTLNISVVMLVGFTSSLTLTLAGICKDVALVTGGVLIFGSPLTLQQVVGYYIGLYGFNCFNLYRAMKGQIEIERLLKEAMTNKSMAVITGGMILLGILAYRSTQK